MKTVRSIKFLGRFKRLILCLALLVMSSMSAQSIKAQGRPDILWMKGLGNYVYNLFPSTDGLTSVTVSGVTSAGSADILIRLVNNADNTVLNTLQFLYGPYDVLATPDCSKIVSFGNPLQVRNALDGSVIWQLTESPNEDLFTGSLKMNPDGTCFGYRYYNYSEGLVHLRILRVSDGVEILNKSNVDLFAFAPSGSEVMIQNGTAVSFWNLPSGSFNRSWIASAGFAFIRGYSPDGTYLTASYSSAGEATALFNVTDGSVAQGFDPLYSGGGYHFPTWIGTSLFMLQPRNGATAIDKWTIGNVYRTELAANIKGDIGNATRAFDGSLAVMGGRIHAGFIEYFDTSTGALVRQDDATGGAIRSVAMTSDGASIVTSGDDNIVRCYDRVTKLLRWKFSTGAPSAGSQPTICISNDNLKVAVAPDYVVLPDFVGLPVSILSMADGSVIQTITEPSGAGITGVAFSPDGSKLATASSSSRLWRLSDGALLGSNASGRFVSFSPDGQYVALARANVYLLRGDNLAYVAEATGAFGGSNNGAAGVSFSNDSTNLTWSTTGNILCFHVPDMTRLWTVNTEDASIRLGPAIYSPDGHVVTGYRTGGGANGAGLNPTQLQILSPLNGNIVKYFDVDTGLSWLIPAFSANGRFMAYGLADSTLVVANAPDVTSPVTTVSVVGSQFTLNANDAGGSGVAHTYFILDGGSQITYVGTCDITTGAHTLVYWSVDNAGNEETHHSANLNIGVPTSLTATGATGPAGTKVTVKGLLKRTDTNAALSGKTLTFKVDGVSVGSANTNASGLASLMVTVPLNNGAHPLLVEFAGDATFQPKSGSATVTTTPAVTGLSLNPTSVTGSMPSIATVTLNDDVTANTVVTITNTNGASHTPATVTVLSGNSSVNFGITTDAVAVTTAGSIKAVLGATNKSATFTVKPPALASLALSATSVFGGTNVTGTVTLTGPVLADITVPLTCTNPKAHLPASVTVAAGTSSAVFSITTDPVLANTAGAVSASFGGVTKSATLTVKPPTYLSFTLTPSTVKGGNDVLGTVTMTGPVAADTTVTLTNLNAKATLPSPTVTIPAGQDHVTFTITTMPTASNVSGAVKAQVGTVTKSVTLKVTP